MCECVWMCVDVSGCECVDVCRCEFGGGVGCVCECGVSVYMYIEWVNVR